MKKNHISKKQNWVLFIIELFERNDWTKSWDTPCTLIMNIFYKAGYDPHSQILCWDHKRSQ